MDTTLSHFHPSPTLKTNLPNNQHNVNLLHPSQFYMHLLSPPFELRPTIMHLNQKKLKYAMVYRLQ
jgi:hypothetical protein